MKKQAGILRSVSHRKKLL